MADIAVAPTPNLPLLDTDISAPHVPIGKHDRTDTLSSVGSAKTLPRGLWKFNLSGNCPICHHSHKSVLVHVKASNDSNHAGEISCDHCHQLWLDIGNRSSTRISLLSTATTEPEPLEYAFRSAIIKMMRSVTTAALSPTLTDIPEASSAGPSRGASVRSTSRGVSQGQIKNTNDSASSVPKDTPFQNGEPLGLGYVPRLADDSETPPTNSQHPRTSKIVLRFRKRIGKLQSKFLGRLFPKKTEMSLKRQGKQPILGSPPSLVISTAFDIQPEAQPIVRDEPEQDSIDVCTPSDSAIEALDMLDSLDKSAIQALTPEQRDKWSRQQITAFKAKYSKSASPPLTRTGLMIDHSTQTNLDLIPHLEGPPSRPNSILAYLGAGFGPHEYRNIFRGSNLTLNTRPLSMSDHLSEADTAVDGASDSPTPRHILVEALQRNRRGSGSPRPHSIHSFTQQVRLNRVENRQSCDSNATGAAVRSITSGRGRTLSRLSRSSMARSSQNQLAPPTSEASGLTSSQEQEHLSSSSLSASPLPSTRLP